MGIEGKYLTIIKAVYDKSQLISYFMMEDWKLFSLKPGTR